MRTNGAGVLREAVQFNSQPPVIPKEFPVHLSTRADQYSLSRQAKISAVLRSILAKDLLFRVSLGQNPVSQKKKPV